MSFKGNGLMKLLGQSYVREAMLRKRKKVVLQ